MSSASVQEFLALKYPEPVRGEKVELLNYRNSAIPGHTHEVRTCHLLGWALFIGSKKDSIRFIENHGLEWTNADAWKRAK